VRPRHFREVGPAHDQVQLLRLGFGLGDAHRADFGNRVHPAGHQAGVRGRRQAERRKRRAPALIGRRTGQRRRTDGVARREYARNIGLVAFIDLHMSAAADGESEPVETDSVQVGHAAEGGQHDVGALRITVPHLHLDLRKPVETCAQNLARAPVPAAHRLECLQKALAQTGIEKSQRFRRLVEQGHRAAQCGENGGILAGDHSAAQHHHGARKVGQAENGIAVQDVFVIHFDGGHVSRPRARREQHSRRAHHPVRAVQALHLHAVRVQKGAAAVNQLDLVALELRL